MKTKKILIYSVIALVAIVIFMIIGKQAGWLGNSSLIKVTTELATNRTIIEEITANGKVQPETEVILSPDVSGEIVELYVKEGDEVKAGDLLLKIKPDTYLSNLSRMEASVNTARANLANAKARLTQIEAQYNQAERSFNRNKSLHEQGAISDSDYETALSAYEVAKADVEAAQQNVNASAFSIKSAEASLREANENLSKTTIYAPMSGTISMLNVEKGERVVGTMQMAGTEMLRIANLNTMEVIVDVNENNIVSISLGDTAVIEIDAYLGDNFKGIVTEIANSAKTLGSSTDQVTNFEVKIRILAESYQHILAENPNTYPFRPGMSASVKIQTETRSNILTVPIQAVTVREPVDTTKTPREERREEREEVETEENTENEEVATNDVVKVEVVFVLGTDGKVYQREVKTGIQDNLYIEITEGLKPEEEIVTAPYSAISKYLENEKLVEKVDKEQLFEAPE